MTRQEHKPIEPATQVGHAVMMDGMLCFPVHKDRSSAIAERTRIAARIAAEDKDTANVRMAIVEVEMRVRQPV